MVQGAGNHVWTSMSQLIRTLGVILNLLSLMAIFFVGLAGSQADTSPREQYKAVLEAVLLAAIPVCNLWLLTHSFTGRGREPLVAAGCLNSVLIAWGAYSWVCELIQYGFPAQPMLFILPFSVAAVSIAAVAARNG